MLMEGFRGFSAWSNSRVDTRDKAMQLDTTGGSVRRGYPLKKDAEGQVKKAALTAGTNEAQTVTVSGDPTGGSFTLTFNGQTTAAIAYNATAAAVQAALEALPNVGTGGVTVTGGPLPGAAVTVTFTGELAGSAVPQMTSTAALTGGTDPAVAHATTVPGVSSEVSDTSLWGFAAEDDGTESDIPVTMPRYPLATLDEEGVQEIDTYPATAESEFEGRISSAQVVTRALIGANAAIGYDDATDTFFVKTAHGTNNLLKITGIRPGEVGKYGGIVTFVIDPAKSQAQGVA
jgi:hypothetical protein